MFTYGLWAAAGISFIFLMTGLGAATVFLFPDRKSQGLQPALMGFSAGVMSAAAVWSLLLPAIEQTAADALFPGWLPAAAGLLCGAGFVTGLELLQRDREEQSLLFAAVTLHNIPEGMAVGLAFALAGNGDGLVGALTLALGIGVQNFPEGAAVSLPLSQSGMSRGKAFMKGILSGAVEPVFAMLALLLSRQLYPAMPWLLAFSAGAMLYVSVHELLHNAEGTSGSLGYMGGFMIMMVLDVALG